MIKEIKTAKFSGLAVLVPDDYYELRISLKKTDHLIYRQGEFYSNWIQLPFACELLGKSTELREEQCYDIVEAWVIVEAWLSYTTLSFTFKEIIPKFMHSIGCYSVNPFGEKPTETFNHPDWEFTRAKWEEAQANTGIWLVLKKL